ncbi:MAG: hypothetical protein FJX76_00510 [Armatimonadetes bacterium]|nr:hypothetical protein [Armatimonadota bacterium]
MIGSLGPSSTRRAYRRVILALALALFCSTPAIAAGPVDTKSHLESDRAVLGQVVRLIVDVSYDPGATVTPPEPDALKFDPLEVRDAVLTPMPATPGRKNLRYTVRLVAWDTGDVTVPPLRIPYKLDGREGMAESAPLKLSVAAMPPAPTDKQGEIRDVKPIVQVAIPAWMIAAASVAGLIALGLLGGLISWLLRRRKRVAQMPPLLPHEWALQELARLEAERLPTLQRTPEHYERLTGIVRGYLSGRFHIPVLERTTSELINEMRARNFDEALVREVRAILDEADLVKFARAVPPTERAEAQVAAARRLVQATLPPPPAEDAPRPPRIHPNGSAYSHARVQGKEA